METRPLPHPIRLLTYLSPGLPLALFGAVADHLRRNPSLGGWGIALASEERVSGPGRVSVERSEDPFSRGEADVGFLCAPTYLGLRERECPPAELLGVAPVFADERAHGEPVYFCDVIVRRGSPARSFWDLEGGAWAFNDPCSLSGHGGLAARLGLPEEAGRFFGRTIRSGSHPASVRLVAGGGADAASIDSNVLRLLLKRTPALREEVRVLDSWGPYPIQPVVVRTGLDQALKAALRESLLGTEADPRTRLELEAFGLKRFAAVGEEDYDAGRLPRPSPGGSGRGPGRLIHPTA
jgi:ABC-type phosphate/phosphonate transport system substrate-binding protein